MVMSIASTIKKIVRNIMLLTVFLGGVIIYNLLTGIKIEKLDLNVIIIDNLYIKLDKRLIVTAKQLKINEEGKSKSSLEQLDKILSNFKLLLTYFEKIYIDKIILKGEEASILYEDELFYIDSKYLNLATLFEFDEEKKTLYFDIKALSLKDYDIFILGNSALNLKKNEFKFSGKYLIKNISGNVFVNADEKWANFHFDSYKTEDIDILRKFIDLDKNIKEWIFDNPKARSYRLDYLTFRLDRKLNFDFNSLKAMVSLDKARVKFHPKLNEIKADSIKVKFVNNRLSFSLDKPTYLGINLQNSFVDIENIMKNPTLNILVKADSDFDRKISHILKSYNIDLPIDLTASNSHSAVKLSIGLLDGKADVKGYFQLENSNININGIKLFAKSGKIELSSNELNLKNLRLKYENMIDANLNLNINFKSKRAFGDIFIKDFTLENGEIISLKNFYSPIMLSFKPNILAIVPNLKLTYLQIKEMDNLTVISLKDISKLAKYSNLLKKLKLKDGNLKVDTEDFKKLNISANLKNLDTPLYKNGKFIGDIKNLSIKIDAGRKDVKISSINKDLIVHIDKNQKIEASLKGYDIFLPDVSKLKDIGGSDKNDGKNSSKKDEPMNIKAKAKDTNIYFGDRVLLSEMFDLTLNNKNITFNSKYENSVFKFRKIKENFTLTGDNISEIFLQSFIQKDTIEGGLYNIKISGDEDVVKGTLTFQNVTVKNLKALNNLVSFIDALPALVTLQTPGFSENGYEINRGSVDFTYFQGTIYINNIDLKGDSIDVTGKGIIYLDKEELDFKLKISTVKNLSKIIKNIPLVGYIILGDGKISTNVNVNGDMNNPNIETNMLEETIKAPLNIIHRTITLPIKFFELFDSKK